MTKHWMLIKSGICMLLLFGAVLQIEAEQKISSESYLEKRKTWLLDDQKTNFSSDIVLTEQERQLDKKISDYVIAFQDQFIKSNHFCPARNFFLVRSCIESSPLFTLLKLMPKGGILHLHTLSSGDANWLVNKAIADPNCYIYTPEDGKELKGKMAVFDKAKVPEGYELMSALAAKNSKFASEVVDMIRMNLEDSNSENPWDKFEKCFTRVDQLLNYAPICFEYYKTSFEALAKDNIQIVELRVTNHQFIQVYELDGKIFNRQETCDLYRKIAEEVRKNHPNFVLKIIFSDMRFMDLVEQRKSLEAGYALRKDNPDLISGYDLIGFETTGHTTLFYLDNLLNSASQFKEQYKIDLPYYFHDGESSWSTDVNLYDAILLNTKRIGHGFNLYHFPKLIQQAKEQNICLEICPISNQVLGYVGDLRLHPAIGYVRQGMPCTISSDDPMMFQTEGLSYDFWMAIMAWNLNLADIKQLCLNSIVYSSLTANEKKQALEAWQKAWQAFLDKSLSVPCP